VCRSNPFGMPPAHCAILWIEKIQSWVKADPEHGGKIIETTNWPGGWGRKLG